MVGPRTNAWKVYLAIGLSLLGCRILDFSTAFDQICMSLSAILSLAGVISGPCLHRPSDRRPWQWIAVSGAFFMFGTIARPYSVHADGPGAFVADGLSLIGYTACIAGFLLLIEIRSIVDRYALADGLTVCLGVACVLWVAMIHPALQAGHWATWISIVSVIYPLCDVVLLLFMLHLGFTTAAARRSTCFRAVSASLLFAFLSDLVMAWSTAHGNRLGPRWADIPTLVALMFIGLGALHPSMVGLGAHGASRVQAWTLSRLGLLVPSLSLPGLLIIGVGGTWAQQERILLAGSSLISVTLVLWRAVAAVHTAARAQEDLEHRVTHDALTDLPNREGLSRTIAVYTDDRPVRPDLLWLLALDLDGFANVNDSWGHRTGDQLLVEVAERIGTGLPATAHLARPGGDEFLVLVTGTCDEARDIAESLRELVSEPFEVDGMDFVVSASIGVAGMPVGEDAVGMLRDADTAMYRAKAAGKDRVVLFGSQMREGIRERVELELALRHAVDRSQLRVLYQPIVDLADEQVVAAEALLRWSHPGLGNISPNDFIPIAEETGLIVSIGAWVLGEAARTVAQWRREGCVAPDFAVSVNVSPRQLRDPGLLQTVEAVLATSGLPAACLVLEITESAAIDDFDVTVEVLRGLRMMGIRLSVDDFGTGFSSLAYLSRLPVTTVKLDRSFVSNFGCNRDDDAIVRAVHAIAGALRLGIVAEGVETTAQRDALRTLGVPCGQGWLWGAATERGEFVGKFGLRAQEPSPDPA